MPTVLVSVVRVDVVAVVVPVRGRPRGRLAARVPAARAPGRRCLRLKLWVSTVTTVTSVIRAVGSGDGRVTVTASGDGRRVLVAVSPPRSALLVLPVVGAMARNLRPAYDPL